MTLLVAQQPSAICSFLLTHAPPPPLLELQWHLLFPSSFIVTIQEHPRTILRIISASPPHPHGFVTRKKRMPLASTMNGKWDLRVKELVEEQEPKRFPWFQMGTWEVGEIHLVKNPKFRVLSILVRFPPFIIFLKLKNVG